MSLVDLKTYLADGGHLQSGDEVNVYKSDLENNGVQDLLPSTYGQELWNFPL
jgi:hypothetical protein